MELILKAKDIRVEFKGRDVLDINELEVYDYDRIGLVGANGAGKSTLLRVLLGELTPHSYRTVRSMELMPPMPSIPCTHCPAVWTSATSRKPVRLRVLCAGMV